MTCWGVCSQAIGRSAAFALLFGAVVFGVGLHHLVATDTCSSTGYSSNYGPVPYCPKGTGSWFAFVFGGVFVVIVGGLVAGVQACC